MHDKVFHIKGWLGKHGEVRLVAANLPDNFDDPCRVRPNLPRIT